MISSRNPRRVPSNTWHVCGPFDASRINIIDFLAQIENFQKKLWLKKKFVVETGYYVR